ncbi:MAG: DUF3616 domain-containing protein [Planctomycetales bacterium]|nr:DUF3616 domain-containing protein [Planctomycetales bacterium]
MIRKICPVLFFLAVCCIVQARPLTIIIVTSTNGSEDGYAEFLQDIYLDNATIEIDDNRYTEPLNDTEKQELLGADLVIVSSDNAGGDYNADSAFWVSLPVPVLSHNIAVCRSNNHANWDWFSSDRTDVSIADFYAVDSSDPLFDGIDLTAGGVAIFGSAYDFSIPDQTYAGNGTPLATNSSGLPVVVRFEGDEPAYYNGSLYGPNHAPRLYFAMPANPAIFFENATPAARQLLRNAVTELLPECWLTGDIDCDRDVDLHDLCELSAQWLRETPPQGDPPAADIDPDGQVNTGDLALLAAFWLDGFDTAAPLPNPVEWTAIPAIQDGGIIQMEAKTAGDDLHGVQYSFECIENALYSSGWQYSREHIAANLPTGINLSFRAKARDTSSRLNETLPSSAQTVRADGLFYRIADASAAVALDSQRFITAGDEDNTLRVYNWNMPASHPLRETDVSAGIGVDWEHPEADIEGATWYNGRVFWITSHGRSAEGDYWPSRYRLFATTIAPDGSATVNGCYTNLIDALIQYDRILNLGLEAAIGTVGDHIDPATIPDLAPKVNGLNIEGLCTTADGTKMYIGFRNPRPAMDGKIMALVIPLANPEAVVLSGAAPVLEPPLFIDLNDLGIRSMEYSSSVGEYLMVAGSHLGGSDNPVLFLYNYNVAAQDKDKLATFSDITPEAIFQFPGGSDIHLLSDDGTRMIDTPAGPVMNKLLPHEQRTYRTRTIKP